MGGQFPNMDISKTPMWVFPKIGVPPKSSILIGFSFINHPFWGSPILETPVFFLHFPTPGVSFDGGISSPSITRSQIPIWLDLRNIGTKVHPMWLQLWFSDLPKKSWAWLRKKDDGTKTNKSPFCSKNLQPNRWNFQLPTWVARRVYAHGLGWHMLLELQFCCCFLAFEKGHWNYLS